MMVAVTLPDRHPGREGQVVLTVPGSGGVLSHQTHLGMGVRLGVDLMTPRQWCTVAVDSPDALAAPVVRALVGAHAEMRVREFEVPEDSSATRSASLSVDLRAAAPWIRVAVADSLDRWLQLPLNQSLVDAERALARACAAWTLPVDAEVRAVVIGESLQLARQASAGFTRYISALSGRRCVPASLVSALQSLVEGYAGLLCEVERSSDRTLSAVLEVWRTLRPRLTNCEGTSAGPLPASAASPSIPMHARFASMIDPRQVRARVFALSADPTTAEVTLANVEAEDGPTVLVNVPAYQRSSESPAVHRLLVRLVDPRSAEPRGQSVLTVAPADNPASSTTYFEGVVRLSEPVGEYVRADVFDALSDIPPAATDTDQALHEVRRAVVFLSEWRRLLATAHLAAPTAPARVIRDLVERLAHGGGAQKPLFPGGPLVADLRALADEGDAKIVHRAQNSDEEATDLFAMVRGPGRLLAAEIAAATADPTA